MRRIAIGIGRPESRERGDVSAYVLRECRGVEMGLLKGDGVVREVCKGLGIQGGS